MRKFLPLLLTAAASVLAACETVPPPPPPPPIGARANPEVFRPADFSWSGIPGASRVDGRVVYRQGNVGYVCSNAVLMPETPWSARRMSILYHSTAQAAAPAAEVRGRTPPAPPELDAFVRKATCDGSGRFSFAGLPVGSWFVITVVQPQNGAGDPVALMRRVLTAGGRSTVVDL
jgi:hypothetical protein